MNGYNLDEVKTGEARELFTVVSTFAGGGGSSTGYRLAGGKILAINEFIEEARRVYNANYPETFIFPQDIRELTGRDILDKIGLEKGELDILDGSPPCASFSMAGLREKAWGKEKKYSDTVQQADDLFFEFARVVKEVQPRVFVAENVKGLTLGASSGLLGSSQLGLFGEEVNTIFHALTDAGYNLRYKVLNSLNYGVPQARERTIFIGVRKDIKKNITFPIGLKSDLTLRKVFEDIKNSDEDLAEADISKYAIGEEANNIGIGESSEKYFSLVKQNPDRYSDTLTQTAGVISAASIIHWENRKFTIPEAKRIMSFPDDYYLGEDYRKKIERLGRAVPPLMMKAVAEHIYLNILRDIR